MRILFMADVPRNPDSGSAGTEYQTISALRAQGHDVEEVWADSIHRRIRHGNLHYLFELPRALRRVMLDRIEGRKFDVVHVSQPHGYLAAIAATKIPGGPVFIHRSHGIEGRIQEEVAYWSKIYRSDHRSMLRKGISRVIGRALDHHLREIAIHADGHIVSCTQCSAYLRTTLGVNEQRVAVIPQAPPDSFLTQPRLPFDLARGRRILYVGQFAFIKAPAIVASVFNAIVEAEPSTTFTWVVGVKDHTTIGSLLAPKARQHTNLQDWMPQDQLIRILDSHGIFLFPSFAEGFGKAFLEAMSRGLIPVASNQGGARDVIIHGKNGIITKVGDVDSLVKECLLLLRNVGAAAALSEAAASTAQLYTWDRVARETLAFYEKRILARAENNDARLVAHT